MGSTGVDASTMTASPAPPPKPPKRGGIHSQYGKYIGGAKLNDNYEMSTGDNSLYRFATQRRHEKTITAIERSLREARDSITAIKFNGTLDTTPGNVNEIGKERFITLLKKRVKEHGQQTFYWIRDSDGKVVDLFDNAHRFKLDTVVAEHKRRLEKRTDFETYDEIERDEVELSRTVVESLLTETFQEKIEIRFSHREDFEFLPGSCLFMMALETCNASAFYDVEGARKKLELLELNSYPGENVTEFASEAQRLIKIMQSAYSMPVNTGSQMIHKVTKRSSELFNRKMWTLLDSAMLLEMEYEMSDHKLFVKDKDYDKYGPLAIVATMQATHGMLLSQHLWPALTATIPQGNAAPVVGGSSGPGNAGGSALNGRKCYRCQGDHLVRDCPQPAPAGGTTGTTSSGGGTAGRVRTPLAAWKYEKPNDVTIPRVDSQGKVWKFCTKCKCRATGKVGYYQLSHYDADHVYNYRRNNGNSTGSPPATDNSTAPPEASSAPQGNLTAVANPNPIPPGPPDVTTPEPTDAHDLHEIQFTGMHGMWIAEVDDDTTADATMTELIGQRSSTPTRARTIGMGMLCAAIDLAVDADATIVQIQSPTVLAAIERENVSESEDEDDDNVDSVDDYDDYVFHDSEAEEEFDGSDADDEFNVSDEDDEDEDESPSFGISDAIQLVLQEDPQLPDDWAFRVAHSWVNQVRTRQEDQIRERANAFARAHNEQNARQLRNNTEDEFVQPLRCIYDSTDPPVIGAWEAAVQREIRELDNSTMDDETTLPTTDDETTFEPDISFDSTETQEVSTAMSEDVSADLKNYVIEEEEYFDTHEVEPMITLYRGHEFFETIEYLPSIPLSWH